MLFNSIPFLCLILCTLPLYYVPAFRRKQVATLTLASFVFYGYSQPWLLVLLILSASINAVSSFAVYNNLRGKAKLWAWLGVIFNLLILCTFKYSKMLISTILDTEALGPVGQLFYTLPLPIGISFYTFQGISLVVDVSKYGEKLSSSYISKSFKTHYFHTLFFITFFAQLVAGPVLKSHQFMPQIREKRFKDIHWDFVVQSLILGYFLKMVIADNLQDQTFWIQYPYFLSKSSLTLIMLLVGYSAQIFADFAGYSLIAIGIAALFGYRLPKNFNFPYISRSITEFWQRWHLSLSSWLKEYLYIPLGGNRKGRFRTYLNLFITMLLGGLWHGDSWNYAVWGGAHGVALATERFCRNRFNVAATNPFIKLCQGILAFSFISLLWPMFKMTDFSQGADYLRCIVTNISMEDSRRTISAVLFYTTPIVLYHLAYLLRHKLTDLSFWPLIHSAAMAFMLFMLLLNSGRNDAFIYFQF